MIVDGIEGFDSSSDSGDCRLRFRLDLAVFSGLALGGTARKAASISEGGF